MPFEIRPPKIDAPEPMRQIAQVKSFLIQLVEQLNIALRTLESGATATSKSETPATTPTVPIAFNEIKALIIKSNDIIDAYYKKMSPKVEKTLSDGISDHNAAEASHADIRKLIKELEEKVDSLPGGGGDIDTEGLTAALEEALRIAKESGDFDGADGKDGVSPTVKVDAITSGHRLTITDKNGEKTVDIIDGQDGKDGNSGVYVGSGDMPDGYNIQIDPEGSDVSSLVFSVNGVKPDEQGNVSIQTGGGGLALSAIDLLIDILQHATYTEDMSSQIERLAEALKDGGSLIITDDGHGNIIITASGSASITDDGEGNVTITASGGVSITDDGNGNVVIA